MKTFDDRKKSVQQYMWMIQDKRRKAIISVTSTVLVVVILALVLFLPFDNALPDVRMYADSEYYGLIQRLNVLRYEPPKHNNNFEVMVDSVVNFQQKGEAIAPGGSNAAPTFPYAVGDSPNASPDEYVEVTDNQVLGVTEADIFKRSDKYVFYLKGANLSVYSIAQSDSELVAAYHVGYDVEGSMADWAPLWYLNTTEMYLSKDCSTITVVMQGYHNTYGATTLLVNLDVSDPKNITEKNRICFVGSYLSSRMTDGALLLVYNYGFRLADVDFDDPGTFVPQYGTPGNMTCIPGDQIICPEDASDTRYTVVCKLDGESLKVEGTVALLSYSQELYVSEDTIYATRSYSQKDKMPDSSQYCSRIMTEITGVSYKADCLEIVDSIAVEGTVKDQYSMDQYVGVLRVVTSTSTSYLKEYGNGEFSSVTSMGVQRNVNLYCIDLNSWQIAAEVIAFAPQGEDAQSVRFDGVNAYVCTAEVITVKDPVYFFDLSDLDNITWTDTGTIDGYSTSLIQLGDGYLLGVGFGESISHLKIEVYEECQDKVVSVCAYERNASFSRVYKSYLVDREHDLVGVPVRYLDPDSGQVCMEFILLHFDGYQLNQIAAITEIKGDMDAVRAFIADGWLYVLCDGIKQISVHQIW